MNIKQKPSFFLLLTIFIILYIYLSAYYKYQINADGISYISIAQKYLSGDFKNAINGYWGPLLSWLLVPFLFFGLPSLLATKALSFIIGLFTLIGVRLLSYKFDMSERLRNLVLFALIPIVIWCGVKAFFPDLLLATILIYYFNVVFSEDYSLKTSKGILCGLLGGAAYLTKSYAFPFFAAHFLLLNVLHYIRDISRERKIVVFKNLILGFAVFSAISFVWIGVISNKYGKFTISASGTYNFGLASPEVPDHPMHYQGFLEPSNETAVSAWEDPVYLNVKPWSPFQSLSAIKQEVRTIIENWYGLFCIYNFFSFLLVPIVVLYALFFILPFDLKKIISQGTPLYTLISVLAYPAGYTMLYVEHRYIWIVYILALLMAGSLLTLLCQDNRLSNARKAIVCAFVIISLIATPITRLIQQRDTGKDIYCLGERLKSEYNIAGNIASNREWHKTLFLAYHLKARYYGEASNAVSPNNLQKELEKNNVDYYFSWDESAEENRILSGYEYFSISDVTLKGRAHNLRIYALK